VRQSPFALTELLGALGIVLVFLAILLPVFANVRDKQRLALCADNERQIGAGLLEYVQDYDNTWPAEERAKNGVYSENGNNAPTRTSWMVAILPYTKTTSIYRCPANGNTTETYPDGTGGTPDAHVLGDYVGNVAGLGNCATGPNNAWLSPLNGLGMFGGIKSPGVRESDVPEPASTIAVYEAFGTNQAQLDPDCSDWTAVTVYEPHNGRANYLFADGHVETLAPMETTAHGCNRWFRNTALAPPYYITEVLNKNVDLR
jgi:prepilin-type processing-associated H-X9-DG protein